MIRVKSVLQCSTIRSLRTSSSESATPSKEGKIQDEEEEELLPRKDKEIESTGSIPGITDLTQHVQIKLE